MPIYAYGCTWCEYHVSIVPYGLGAVDMDLYTNTQTHTRARARTSKLFLFFLFPVSFLSGRGSKQT